MSLSKNSVAVVTGAASGIGRALAVRLASEKIAGIAVADVNETGLDETVKLAEAAGGRVSKHVVDTSQLDAIERLKTEVLARHGRVTHLVNNAGVALCGTFEQISIEDFEWLMSINFWGVVYGCKVFLPVLKAQEAAHIVNISSVFGFVAPPEQSAYCASKFAVRGFTESLRHELAGSNVRISAVHPGGIKTHIARNARVGENTPDNYKTLGVDFFDKVAMTTPEQAAETILRGIKTENPRILIGRDAIGISLVSRLFPKKYLRVLERLSGHKFHLYDQ
ncbi:MAG: SDR family oxidoreductase [Acidobacteria bacterium]|nr:SDR family oxidoreductase [Acidobacteriota bacterium]